MESNKKFFYSVGIFSITLLIWMIFPIDVQASLNCGDPGVVCRQGTLAGDETWTSENIYVITDSDLIIPIGVTLTIEEGTIIKITDNWLELIVDGSLIINGQSDNRVYITSIHDDLGGDTNHDTTSPSAGNW